MKKLIMCSLLLCCIMFFVAGSAFAAKPTNNDGVYIGNGFPSGPHFNLNIHGKDPATFTCPEPTEDGGYLGYWKLIPDCEKDPITEEYGTECYKLDTSIFMPEYNCRFDDDGYPLPERIIVQSGKKKGGKPKGVTLPTNQLIVTDACTECIPDDYDEAQFQLPPCDEGYRVYARVLGTPSNKKDTDRTIELSSGDLLTAEDEHGYNLLELGRLTSNGYIKPNGDYSFTRNAKKSMGEPINDLFMFTGSICYFGIPPGDWDSCNAEDPEDTESPCRNFEGTVCCTPVIDTDTGETIGHVEDTCVLPELDGTCDDVEKDLFDVYCQYYDNVWIFGIADLVEYYFGVVNDGVKLIQIRFYPICDLAQQ